MASSKKSPKEKDKKSSSSPHITMKLSPSISFQSTLIMLGILIINFVSRSEQSSGKTQSEDGDIGYTYDRIILGVITSLLCLYIILQIILTFYYKHKVPSFHFGFLVLCCLWMIIRTVYYFSVIENCGVYFLYYLPICVEFAVFTLLVVFFFKLLNYGGKWDKCVIPIRDYEMMPTSQSGAPSSPQTTSAGILTGAGVTPSHRRSSRHHHHHTTNYGAVGISGSHQGSLNTVDDDENTKTDASFVSQNIDDDSYEEETKSGYYQMPRSRLLNALLKFVFTRKVLYALAWLTSNAVFLAFILAFCITSCTTAIDIEHTNSIIGFASACSFTILMAMLLVIGVRMVYIFRKRNDIPVSLKVSRITGPGMIVVIIVNCFVFTSRAIFDCLILIPNFPKDYLKIQFLRSTDYGKVFIVVTNFVWEIIPILSILIFFSKWTFAGSSYNINLRRQMQDDEPQESETTSNVAGSDTGIHPFDPNTPLIISTKSNYFSPNNRFARRSQSSGYLAQQNGYAHDGETTESSLYDDIETDSSYSPND